MRKEVAVLFFAVLLFSFVVGQENKTDLNESLKEISGRINMGDIQSNLVLPDFVQGITRFVFQIEADREIGIEYFIVLVGVFLVILAIVAGVIYITPLHREPVEIFIFKFNTDYLMGLIIVLIIALTGVINSVVADWFFSLGLYRELVSKMGWGVIFLILFILIVLFFAVRMLFGMLRRRIRRETAKGSGEDVNMLRKIAKINAESTEKLSEE
ncbi:MAG: hypothetical protein WC494_00070 [Candidatus Pacearchaeota archaeon]